MNVLLIAQSLTFLLLGLILFVLWKIYRILTHNTIYLSSRDEFRMREDDFEQLFSEAKALVLDTENCSVSFLQRKLRIGYVVAVRIVDRLEELGVVSKPDKNHIRKVHGEGVEDDLLLDAIDFVREERRASTGALQRHFQIGYARAARLLDLLEDHGVIEEAKQK